MIKKPKQICIGQMWKIHRVINDSNFMICKIIKVPNHKENNGIVTTLVKRQYGYNLTFVMGEEYTFNTNHFFEDRFIFLGKERCTVCHKNSYIDYLKGVVWRQQERATPPTPDHAPF